MLAHNDHPTKWWHCSHPLVSLIDGVLLLLPLLGIYASRSWYGKAYFGIVALQLAVSMLYHRRYHSKLLMNLDHAAIYLLIVGTVFPYIPLEVTHGKVWFLTVLLQIGLIGMVMKHRHVGSRTVNTLLFAFAGVLAVITMWGLLIPIDPLLGVVFWVGIALYGVQMLVYHFKWFDWWLPYVGHREVQHVVLAVAIMSQTFVVFAMQPFL